MKALTWVEFISQFAFKTVFSKHLNWGEKKKKFTPDSVLHLLAAFLLFFRSIKKTGRDWRLHFYTFCNTCKKRNLLLAALKNWAEYALGKLHPDSVLHHVLFLPRLRNLGGTRALNWRFFATLSKRKFTPHSVLHLLAHVGNRWETLKGKKKLQFG